MHCSIGPQLTRWIARWLDLVELVRSLWFDLFLRVPRWIDFGGACAESVAGVCFGSDHLIEVYAALPDAAVHSFVCFSSTTMAACLLLLLKLILLLFS